MMNERRRDIGGAESFLEKNFEQVILFAILAGLQRLAQPADQGAGAGFLPFLGGRRFAAMNACFRITLDMVDLKEFAPGDEGDGASAPTGPTGAADAMDIILHVVRQIVIENDFDILDIDP